MLTSTNITKRATICFLVFLGFSSISGLSDAQDYASENWGEWNAVAPEIFPGTTWMKYQSPEEAGWSSEKLAKARHWFDEADSAALMVIYNGAVLLQWGDTQRRYKNHSVRKSLLSALYGNAVGTGEIRLDATLDSLGINDDLPLTETEKTATVSDLLKSRSGIYIPAAYESRSMAESRPERGSNKPGEYWYYNNWDFNVLGSIYRQQTSTDVFEAFDHLIARPLQMQDYEQRHGYYHLEAWHSRHPAYPFRMSARDLARFGYLYLKQGRWADQQVIPKAWVAQSTKAYSYEYSTGYGYMWWTIKENTTLGRLGTYWAAGYGGQWIYVIPAANLVVVHRAD
ncbi:MAG: serine hydrolase, partial [Pseudomonadota bacterium]